MSVKKHVSRIIIANILMLAFVFFFHIYSSQREKNQFKDDLKIVVGTKMVDYLFNNGSSDGYFYNPKFISIETDSLTNERIFLVEAVFLVTKGENTSYYHYQGMYKNQTKITENIELITYNDYIDFTNYYREEMIMDLVVLVNN